MTTPPTDAEKAQSAALRSLWIIDTAMRRPARESSLKLAGWALFYATLAAIPAFIGLWLLLDAPQGRLPTIGATMLEDLRPPVEDRGRENSRRFVERLTAGATSEYKSYTGGISFFSFALIVALLLAYALFAQLRLMVRYLRRIDGAENSALARSPVMVAVFSVIAVGLVMVFLRSWFDLPGPLSVAAPSSWYIVAVGGVILTAALSAVTLQGTRLIAWNYMKVEWAEALDEELKRAKRLGLSADEALNAALEVHPRPIARDMGWSENLRKGSLTVPPLPKKKPTRQTMGGMNIQASKATKTVELGDAAPSNWATNDPIVSTTMLPSASLALVKGLCRLYAIVLVAVILLAGYWLKSLTIVSAEAEVPAYTNAVRASVDAWLAATGLAASLVLAVAYVGSVLRLIPFVAAEDALKPEPARSKKKQTHSIAGFWGDKFVHAALSEGQDDNSAIVPDPFKKHEARLGMSRKKFRIIRRSARVGGAFHHLTSTSFSGQVSSLLNLVLPAAAGAVVSLFG